MKSKSAPRNCNLAARAAVFLAIGSSAILAVPSRAQSYDLVINGGRVMDPETMFDDIDTGLDAMKDRGRVQVGKVADLTLFDPKTARDNATYKVGESGLPSTGIPCCPSSPDNRFDFRPKRGVASNRSSSTSGSGHTASMCRICMKRMIPAPHR